MLWSSLPEILGPTTQCLWMDQVAFVRKVSLEEEVPSHSCFRSFLLISVARIATLVLLSSVPDFQAALR